MKLAPIPASPRTYRPAPGERRSDTPAGPAGQGRRILARPLRMSALIRFRWAHALVQATAVAATVWLLRWPVHVLPCVASIGAALAMNLALTLSPAARREARPFEAAGQLTVDIVLLWGLLHLIGGIVNPFAVLLIGPVTVAGAAAPPRHALVVAAVAMAATVTLAAVPVAGPHPGAAPEAYRAGLAAAMILVVGFAGGFAAWSAQRGTRIERALRVAETVLAREQRLSALGALAAAIAHELGTPLATISVVATELARDAPTGPVREDAVLLVEQARRCRDILGRLAASPDQADVLYDRMSLADFAREIAAPVARFPDLHVTIRVSDPPGAPAPEIWRRREALHALGAIVENAVDFADEEVRLSIRFDAAEIVVEVGDDGPGFTPGVMAQLGEPYITHRRDLEVSRTGRSGMGLGLFIAKTLLERTGARILFANSAPHGAVVTVRWPRPALEAAPAAT